MSQPSMNALSSSSIQLRTSRCSMRSASRVVSNCSWRRRCSSWYRSPIALRPGPEAGADEIGALDDAGGERCIELLLDDVRLPVLDAGEAVRHVNPVADVLGRAVDEVELRRVREPRGDQLGGFGRAGAL